MSLKKILKDKRKNQARKSRGKIVADDAMITGHEPDWNGWETWDVEKFFKEHARALRFYNYYCKAKDLKKDVILWMDANDYSKDEIRCFKKSPDHVPGMTTGALCRCINNGMPSLHPDHQDYVDVMKGRVAVTDDEDFIHSQVRLAIAEGRKVVNEVNNDPNVKPKVSPLVHLENKINRGILVDIGEMLDLLIENINPKKLKFDLYKRLHDHAVPANGLSFVEAELAKQYNEMAAAYNKEDPDLVEGYSYLTRPQLLKWIEYYDGLYADLEKYKASLKSKRKPRKAKAPPTAEKQVSKLKYQDKDADYKLTSIHPTKIIGAERLLVFNTKYRILTEYVSDNPMGFEVKGTTLQHVDEEKSRAIKLRKPDDFLPIVLNKTARQIDTAWKKLTTKESTPNARINDSMVLLRTL